MKSTTYFVQSEKLILIEEWQRPCEKQIMYPDNCYLNRDYDHGPRMVLLTDITLYPIS